MITSEEFLAYVAETVRDELWIDHDAYCFGNDIYIPACVSMWYGSYYEFYIRNAKVELRHSNQNALSKGGLLILGKQSRFICPIIRFGLSRRSRISVQPETPNWCFPGKSFSSPRASTRMLLGGGNTRCRG